MIRLINAICRHPQQEPCLSPTSTKVLSGAPGFAGQLPPSGTLQLLPVGTLLASQMGPAAEGSEELWPHVPGLWEVKLDRESPAWACGRTRSCYDMPSVGTERSGEPFADAFGVLGFSEGAFLAVADGVGWGVKPRRAARCAVLASMQYMLGALQASGGSAPQSSDATFRAMLNAMRSAQQLILRQGGSLTTLVMATVCRIRGARPPNQYALMTVTVGDSAAFVWRRVSRSVDEVTYASHADTVREVRMCPGSLGPAVGDSPDLENLTCSLTTLAEGDVVLLGSDGVADNLDPTVLRLSRPPPKPVAGPLDPIYDVSLPITTPQASQEHVVRRLLSIVEARPLPELNIPPQLSAAPDGTGATICTAVSPARDSLTGESSSGSITAPLAADVSDSSVSPKAAMAMGFVNRASAAGSSGCSSPLPALSTDITAARVCERVIDYVWKTTLPARTFVEIKTRERLEITTAAAAAADTAAATITATSTTASADQQASGAANTGPSSAVAAADAGGATVNHPAEEAAAAAVARITAELVDAMQRFPGKMDHVTVAAYVVGQHRSLR